MKNYPLLVSVNTKNDFTLMVNFNNGENRIFDMSKLISNDVFFSGLKDNLELFSKCKVFGKGYAVVWNDEIDLAAEYIYDNSIAA